MQNVRLIGGDSIEGQLNGTIPSTDAGQRQDPGSLIDASHIDIEAMGQFDMGGSSGGGKSDDMPSMEGFDFSGFDMPSGFGDFSGSFPGSFGSSSMSKMKNLLSFGICLVLMIISLVALKLYKRNKGTR